MVKPIFVKPLLVSLDFLIFALECNTFSYITFLEIPNAERDNAAGSFPAPASPQPELIQRICGR